MKVEAVFLWIEFYSW